MTMPSLARCCVAALRPEQPSEGFAALNLIHADALATLPPVEFLAETHLVARGLNVLFGPSGVYKSFYMLAQALTVAQVAPVVYIAAEGASGLDRRCRAWCEYHGKSRGLLFFLTQEVNLLDWKQVKQLAKTIYEQVSRKTGLVIVDTYARCMIGGDENSARDTGLTIHHCAELQRRLGCAVALIHHTNKAERSERGSGAIRGAMDAMIEMSNLDGVVRVDCAKLKDGEPWAPEHYRFQQTPDHESGVLVPARFADQSPRMSVSQIKVLEHLSLEVFRECGSTSRQVSEGTNIAIGTVWRVLSGLKRNSHVIQDTKGDPYRISEAGKKALLFANSQVQEDANVIDMRAFRGNSQ